MKLILKFLILTSCSIVLIYGTLFLTISDPQPSFFQSLSKQNEPILLSKIQKIFDEAGSLKTVLAFRIDTKKSLNSFIGQKIILKDNFEIDEIIFGIENQQSLVIMAFRDGLVIKEARNVIKANLPLSTPINLFASYNRNNPAIIKSSEQTLHVKLCEGMGFFGDFATIKMDLKEFQPNFQETALIALNHGALSPYQLASIAVWKNYKSFD